MSKEQQTALEYLLQELKIEELVNEEQLTTIMAVIIKAREMEREQIVEAYCKGAEMIQTIYRHQDLH